MPRVVAAVLAVAVVVAGFWLAAEVGPLRGCRAVAPRELPSGGAPGPGVEDVSGGAKQVIWGSGVDGVEQIVGLRYDDGFEIAMLGAVEIGQMPAMLYRFKDPSMNGGLELAISWEEGGCSLTLFLPAGMTEAEARDYATRY
jgi:hypothetical protein